MVTTQDFVLTAIGADRPGLVEALAAVIAAEGGSWQESSMAHLSGKFVGLVRVSVPAARAASLQAALQAFTPLRLVVEPAAPAEAAAPAVLGFSLELVGHDRIGIVREVSQVLAQHAVNVESLETFTSQAPMSGELLFHAQAHLRAAATLDVVTLQAALESLSNELQVDIVFDHTGA
jgi:glycine cleavage system regulatory protein